MLIYAGHDIPGDGIFQINNRDGESLIRAGSGTGNRAFMSFTNKTGEEIIQLYADDYGGIVKCCGW